MIQQHEVQSTLNPFQPNKTNKTQQIIENNITVLSNGYFYCYCYFLFSSCSLQKIITFKQSVSEVGTLGVPYIVSNFGPNKNKKLLLHLMVKSPH